MADIIVQPKVLNADGTTYDNLIMQNAVNAIKNADGTYSGFTQNANGVLLVDNQILYKVIEPTFSVTSQSYGKEILLTDTNIFKDGDVIKIYYTAFTRKLFVEFVYTTNAIIPTTTCSYIIYNDSSALATGTSIKIFLPKITISENNKLVFNCYDMDGEGTTSAKTTITSWVCSDDPMSSLTIDKIQILNR